MDRFGPPFEWHAASSIKEWCSLRTDSDCWNIDFLGLLVRDRGLHPFTRLSNGGVPSTAFFVPPFGANNIALINTFPEITHIQKSHTLRNRWIEEIARKSPLCSPRDPRTATKGRRGVKRAPTLLSAPREEQARLQDVQCLEFGDVVLRHREHGGAVGSDGFRLEFRFSTTDGRGRVPRQANSAAGGFRRGGGGII